MMWAACDRKITFDAEFILITLAPKLADGRGAAGYGARRRRRMRTPPARRAPLSPERPRDAGGPYGTTAPPQ